MKFALIMFSISVIIYPLCQVLQKIGLNHIPPIDSLGQALKAETLFKIITNPYIIIAGILLVINFGIWMIVLSNMNVSYAYPLGALAYIVAAFMALYFLHEPITIAKWLGIVSIVIGAFLINWG